MANADIGSIKCFICGGNHAAVRQQKNGRYYYHCAHCGHIRPALPGGQEILKANMVLFSEDTAANEEKGQESPGEKIAEAGIQTEETKGGILGGIDL